MRATLIVALLVAVDALAQTCPEIELQPVVVLDPTSPIFVTHAGDGTGRLFIAEQPGVVKVLPPGSSSSTVFLMIPTARILSGEERGLLGLAFHPDYETNRRFFVNYTKQPDGASVIAEYQASAVQSQHCGAVAD